MKLNEVLNIRTSELLCEMSEEEARIAAITIDNALRTHLKLRFDPSGHFGERTVPKYAYNKNGDRILIGNARENDVTKEELYDTIEKMIRKHKKNILRFRPKRKEVEFCLRNSYNQVNLAFKVAFQEKVEFPLFRPITLKRKKNFICRYGDVVLDV